MTCFTDVPSDALSCPACAVSFAGTMHLDATNHPFARRAAFGRVLADRVGICVALQDTLFPVENAGEFVKSHAVARSHGGGLPLRFEEGFAEREIQAAMVELARSFSATELRCYLSRAVALRHPAACHPPTEAPAEKRIRAAAAQFLGSHGPLALSVLVDLAVFDRNVLTDIRGPSMHGLAEALLVAHGNAAWLARMWRQAAVHRSQMYWLPSLAWVVDLLPEQDFLALVGDAQATESKESQWQLLEVAHLAGRLDVKLLESLCAAQPAVMVEAFSSTPVLRFCQHLRTDVEELMSAGPSTKGLEEVRGRLEQRRAHPPPYQLEGRPALRLVASTRKSHPALPPSDARCRCRRPLEALARLRLRDMDAAWPDDHLSIYWCADCAETGAVKKHGRLERSRWRREDGNSRTGEGRTLRMKAFTDYPAPHDAEAQVDASHFDATAYRAFVERNGGSTSAVSRAGGYPYFHQEHVQLDFEEAPRRCGGCRKTMGLTLQLVDDETLRPGEDLGILTVATCVTPGCARPSVRGWFDIA